MLTSLQALLRLAVLQRLGVFICALATLLAAANTASALEPAQTKTRVWGFDFAADNSSGLFLAATSGKHQGNCFARAEEASGSLLAARAGGGAFKAFTAGNFRHNLAHLTGGIPKGAQAHHVLPQKFAAQFEKAGLNIHDPKFGAWWEAGAHGRAASGYNQAWQTFFESPPGATGGQILDFGRGLAGKYGLTIGF